MEALTVRQFQLLEHFAEEKSVAATPQGTNVISNSTTLSFEEMIRTTRQQLATGAAQMADADRITLVAAIGSGSYGSVHLAQWRGAQVAVKRMLLPHNMSSTNRASAMAAMEVAITSSVSHPNLVQLYTYRVSPVMDSTLSAEAPSRNQIDVKSASILSVAAKDPRTSDVSDAVAAYEILMVLEYCDGGSLRSVRCRPHHLPHLSWICERCGQRYGPPPPSVNPAPGSQGSQCPDYYSGPKRRISASLFPSILIPIGPVLLLGL